jgi:phosphate starvation-inducible protein PhoH
MPKTENQQKFIDEILNNEAMYVIATGIAGAGKNAYCSNSGN